MKQETRRLLVRILLGSALGLLVGIIWIPYVIHSRESSFLAVLACVGLGAMAGLATQPFADSGRALLLHSMGHFVCTAAFFALLVVELNMAKDIRGVLFWESLLLLLYLLIWLGRWTGWYLEVAQLRELLGLDPGPTPLKWRETLPYLPFVLLLCTALPLGLRGIERAAGVDLPALTGLVYPYLILPVASLCAGLSLGKRQGVCPLFPIACFVCYLPMVYLLFNESALFHCFMTAIPALAGNILGALWRKNATLGRRTFHEEGSAPVQRALSCVASLAFPPDLFDRCPRQPAGGLLGAHPGSAGPEAQKQVGRGEKTGVEILVVGLCRRFYWDGTPAARGLTPLLFPSCVLGRRHKRFHLC